MDIVNILSPVIDEIQRRFDQSLEKAIKELNPPAKPEAQEGNIDFAVSVIKTISKSRIYKLTMDNAIPHKKRGGRTLWFNRVELEQWLEDGMPNYGEEKITKKLGKSIK